MKHLATKLLFISALFFSGCLVLLSAQLNSIPQAKAQESELSRAACIARDLAVYMNRVIQGAGNLNHVKLLSPAFNLTNPEEALIFETMINQGGEKGNFAGLDGFAGNAYSHVPGDGLNITSYQWYATNVYSGRTWKQRFAGKPMFFTEYGDFNYPANPGSVGLAATVHSQTAGDSTVSSINYFNALGGNPEFTRHQLSPDEYNQVTGSNSAKAGVNSANGVTAGSFANLARSYSPNVHWLVEISYSQGDVNTVVSYVRQAYLQGMKPILRICAGNSCDFANPNDYVAFLKSIDSQITDDLWVIAGPNEPATELWATPACITQEPFDFASDCRTLTDPEYHSLRPYPANPLPTVDGVCNKPHPTYVNQCGNDFTIQETIEVNRSQAVGPCTGAAGEPQICSFRVDSSLNAEIDLSQAQLPIMGNTQLVPNSTNPTATLTFKDRMAGYASWYLNGVIQRAEEQFFTFPGDQDLMLSMSGPIRKILPYGQQNAYPAEGLEGLRIQQAENAGDQRHDQVATCGSRDNPQPCYSAGIRRILQIVAGSYTFVSPLTIAFDPSEDFDYIPFSSTEDRTGQASFSLLGAGGDGVTISNLTLTPEGSDVPTGSAARNLYYAHMQEVKELAKAAQQTFVPSGSDGLVSDAQIDSVKTDDIVLVQQLPGCEIEETRSNAGDDLYGELERDGVYGEQPLQATISYRAEFTCEFTPTVDQGLYYACWAGGYCDSPSACAINGGTWNPDTTCTPGLGRCVLPNPPAGVFDNIGCREASMAYPTTCQKTIGIPMAMSTNTPEAASVWNRLVAGPWSIFRRFFPRVGPGSPLENIKDIPAETISGYFANNLNTTGGSSVGVNTLTGNNRSGPSAEFYIPHVGSIQDYFLEGIQCALRPLGLCGNETYSGDTIPEEEPGTPGNTGESIMCPYNQSEVQAAMTSAANKYGVPVEMLEAIYQTEGLVYRTIGNQTCEPNFAGAIGMMQIRTPTYNIVTCENERPADEFAQCTVNPPLLSRCDVRGAFELAARVLLLDVGEWGYGPGRCLDLGNIPNTDGALARRAGCAYAGYNIFNQLCYHPTTGDGISLINYATGALARGEILACRDGDCRNMDYGDWVCAWMAARNGRNYCNTPNNFPDRSGDGTS